MLKIPQNISKIISVLEQNGFEAYVVGGAVRDALLCHTPEDYDITTSCPPEKITELFEKTIPTGIKHGTVTVVMDSVPTEVTTYRIDGSYSDNRSPNSVTFTRNLKDDLSRRDFTVNALAFNDKCGLVDLFSGSDDLKNKIIRTVGNPDTRFREDALRILRAIRFGCTLKFSIEPDTYKAAIKHAEALGSISGERIFAELTKALMGENTELLEGFINSGGLAALEITNAKNFSAIDRLPQNLPLRLFAFLTLTDADYEPLSTRLHFSNKLKHYLDKMFIISSRFKGADKSHIKTLLGYSGTEIFADYLEYRAALFSEDISKAKALLTEITENNEPYKISMLDINGKDLEQLGFFGEEIGKILNDLLVRCINDPSLNRKQTLLEIIK